MYGTVAKLTAKPGAGDQVVSLLKDNLGDPVGYVARIIFQMEDDPDELWVAGWFESKAAYFTHSDKPETHQTYLKLLELLMTEPEWHDGHVVNAAFAERPE